MSDNILDNNMSDIVPTNSCNTTVVTNPSKFHNSNSCCNIVFKKPCQKDLLIKLQTPLEETFPEIFGDFDEEQKLLIKYGAKPVVIVENASEFISMLKNIDGFIEQIIDYIIKDNKSKFVSLGSFSFPPVLKKEWKITYPTTDYDEIYTKGWVRSDKYDKLIKKIKPKNIPNKALLHMAIDLGGSGGHYGIAIKNDNKVIVFDSMQINGNSHYSGIFAQIANDVFGILPSLLLNPTNLTCPQPTGGFVRDREKDETEYRYLYVLQNMDSQNHFCYFWAIWYFHIFITKGDEGIDKIFNYLHENCIPSLGVIKRYIWSIIHSLYPDDSKLKLLLGEAISKTIQEEIIPSKNLDFLTRFFIMNFRYIWDDLFKTYNFQLYSVIDCDLSKIRNMTNINECLYFSTEKFPYILDNFSG